MAMRQKEDESLKDYVVRFNQAKLTVDNPTEEMVYAALYQGLRVEGPLMSEIALNHPENLVDLTDVIEKYVNLEEILAALRESQKQKISESSNPRKKEKIRKEEKRTETKKATEPAKYYQFSIDEWTPLNSPINEVLMEIKRDPQYERPYPFHNKYVKEENRHKFCVFHDARGHVTYE
jgi:tRNA/tmRNA/rRNA uracil-C5-methylase (TrmA/RlmC/RlmD family)